MATVAVIGTGTLVGRAVLARLRAEDTVEAVIGVDAVEPDVPVGKLRCRAADLCGGELSAALDGVDVIVHCGLEPEPRIDEQHSYARVVAGSRNLLEAAAKVGAAKAIIVSSTCVYGALPDNELPLSEDAPLRATADFPIAHQLAQVERLAVEWADEHPGVTLTLLRAALTLGPGACGAWCDHLRLPRLPLLGGQSAPWQFVAADDVAAAVALACVQDAPGAFNVAADGWVPAFEAAALLGRRVLTVPETTACTGMRVLWGRGLCHLPSGALPYLMYPWVCSAERLKSRGWEPVYSNRELLRAFAAEHVGYVTLGRRRVRRDDLHAPAYALAGALAGVPVGFLLGRSRIMRHTARQ